MYISDRGVEQLDTEAVQWFEIGAEQGNADAQVNHSFMYKNGRGVQQSDTEAFKWCKKAAEQGNVSLRPTVSLSRKKSDLGLT
jgi:TPR repeat protein